MRTLIIVLSILAVHGAAAAQVEESIVVTGTRNYVGGDIPGTVLRRNGDFLLLPVTVINDSREEAQRHEEIYKTLRNLLDAAKRDGNIEVSIPISEGFVRPLTKENYRIDLAENQRRRDTSRAAIRVSAQLGKSPRPDRLIEKLRSFVRDIRVVGRTEFDAADEVEVSIVDPNQYRGEIIGLVARDIKRVTAALGENYRIRLSGIDRQVKWVRSGLSEVTLYIPYTYEVLPAANAYFVNPSDY